MRKILIAICAILLLTASGCHFKDYCWHIWGKWMVTTPATCNTDGEQVRKCLICGDTEAQPIGMQNHIGTATKEIITTPPDCINGGSKDTVCSCGTVIRTEFIPALGHSVVTDPAVRSTCQSTGLTEGSHCSACGKVFEKQEVTKLSGHAIVTSKAVQATCYSTGLTEGRYCIYCGFVIVKQKSTPTINHVMAQKLVTATTLENEYILHFCIFCDHSHREEIPGVSDADHTVDKLNFTLSSSDYNEFLVALKNCVRLYKTANFDNAGKLTTELYKMKTIRDRVMRQWNIADLFSNYDLSDSQMQENYDSGRYYFEMIRDRFREPLNAVAPSDNPLRFVVENFYNTEYPDVTYYSYDVSEYRERISVLEKEFETYNKKGTAKEIHGMYTEYLEVSRKYAIGCGYDNYYDYSSKDVYHRDYGKEEREIFRQYVRDYLVPLYKKLDKESKRIDRQLTKEQYQRSIDYNNDPYDSFGENLLFSYIDSLPEDAATIMKTCFEKERILIGDQPNSYNGAWVTHIGTMPYCYFHKDEMDLLTMAHELGHYYADSVIGTNVDMSYDVKEIHSQGSEMLMLRYVQNKLNDPAFDSYVAYKLSEELYQTIYSAIRDEFTEIMLSDPKASNFSIREINGVMEGLLEKYNATNISSTFTRQQMTFWHRLGLRHPAYDISYATSFVVAYQIYCNSETDYEGAVEQYCKIINNMDPDSTFLQTIKNAGLISPFEEEAYSGMLE